MLESLLATIDTDAMDDHPVGEVIFTPGEVTEWTVPEGVYRVSVVMIGNSSAPAITTSAATYFYWAGASGGLRYRNNIPVKPGEVYEIVTAPIIPAVAESKNNIAAVATGLTSALGIFVGDGSVGSPIDGIVKGGYGSAPGSGNGSTMRRADAGTYDNGTRVMPKHSNFYASSKSSSLFGPNGTTHMYGRQTSGSFIGSSAKRSRGASTGGAVRIVWGKGREFPDKNVGDSTLLIQPK